MANRFYQSLEDFLAMRRLSSNSLKSYGYDVSQFLKVVGEQIDQAGLSRYEQTLLPLAASARNRKLSVVNQFLYFLYQQGQLDQFYRLTSQAKLPSQLPVSASLDLSALYQPLDFSAGQLIALLILDLGLTPSQILSLEWAWLDLDFQVLRLVIKGQVRVLSLTEQLLACLRQLSPATYLFEHQGKPYSRQWLHRELAMFLIERDLPDLNAQKLRQEYIKHQVAAGVDALSLSKKLGLKSPVSLEKYYK